MQGINMEKAKSFDSLPFQIGFNQSGPIKTDSSFKNSMKKAFEEKSEQTFTETMNQASEAVKAEDAKVVSEGMTGQAENIVKEDNSTDMQLATLINMMAEANMTVEPFALNNEPVVQGQVQPEIVAHNPETAQQGKDVQTGQQTGQSAQNTEVAQSVASSGQGTAQQENGLKQERQQTSQTAHTDHGKSEDAVSKKQKPTEAKSDQPTAKHIDAKPAETKQAEAKEVKQEMAAFTKQEPSIDPEKIYIKVGEGQELDQEELTSKLSEKILKNLSDGKTMFEIELMPKDLGKIVIKMVVNNGTAQLIMQCLNPKTQQLVTMNADAIRTIVEERTGMQTTVTVKEEKETFDARDGKENQNKQSKEEQQQDKKLTEGETDIFLNQLRLGLVETLQF